MEKSKKQLKDFESEIRPNSEFLGLFREELINMAEREHNHKKKDKSSTQYTKKSQIEKTTVLGESNSNTDSDSDTDSSTETSDFSSKDIPAKLIKPTLSNHPTNPVKSNKSTVQSIRPNKPIINSNTKDTNDTKEIKEMGIKVIEKTKQDIKVESSTKPVQSEIKSESDKNLDSESKMRILNDNLEKSRTKEKTEPIILDELELSEYEIIKLKEIVKYFVDIKR